MRIIPINNHKNYIQTRRSNQTVQNSQNVNFQRFEHGAFHDKLRAMLYDNFMPRLKNMNAEFFKKLETSGFGAQLTQKIFQHYKVAKDDLSEFALGMRKGIVAAGFVSYAQGVGADEETEKSCANTYLVDNWDKIHRASNLLGQNTLLYATSLKRARFEKLLSDVEVYNSKMTMFALKNMLVQKLNPVCSEKYQRLEIEKEKILSSSSFSRFSDFYSMHKANKAKIKELELQIKELKQNFSSDSKQKIKELYKDITAIRRQDFEQKPEEMLLNENLLIDIKAQQNKLLKESVKDPQKKIELFYLYNAMSKYDVRTAATLDDFINNNVTEEQAELLKKHVVLCVQNFLNLNNKECELFYRLKINESPYFSKILEADFDTIQTLKLLFSTIAEADGDVNKAFVDLAQNKITQEIFEEQGYDYDVWTGFDETRDVIRIDDRTVIKKVDMNDIQHSLFLGNQVGCCTAIGLGSRANFAASYVMNKFVQAIELVVDGKPVGNTMCYLARKSDGENILVLDNIEVIPFYKDDNKYLEMFIRYAEKLVNDIGAPNMKIYAGHRNNFEFIKRATSGSFDLVILGSTGEHNISLDSIKQMNGFWSMPLERNTIYRGICMYDLKDVKRRIKSCV